MDSGYCGTGCIEICSECKIADKNRKFNMSYNYQDQPMESQSEWLGKGPKQEVTTGNLQQFIMGAERKLPKSGEPVLAKITIPAKTMGYFYAVIYHNGHAWLPKEHFQDDNKIIDFKPVEECF